MTPGFWHNRAVFLTGHTGFMGGWLSFWLAELGARLTGYALTPPTRPNFFSLSGLETRLHSLIADIRDPILLKNAILSAEPEIVFHLAAQPLVRDAYRRPAETFETNEMGTVNLLEAIRHCPSVRAVVIVTSDKVYANQEWAWGYRESDRLGGREPYGASKAAAEIVVDSYRASYFASQATPCAIATVRAGNIIGGGDWAAERLVPDAIRAFVRGQTLAIRHPEAVRPWQHVLEPLNGYLCLAEKLIADPDGTAGPWNFGPAQDDIRPVAWLADRISELWGDGAHWHHANESGPYEATLLAVDSAKAHQKLGWRPVWTLDHGLAETVAWYKAEQRGADCAAQTASQIERFQEAA